MSGGELATPEPRGRRSLRRRPVASVKALAAHHGVSEHTVRRWLAAGRFPGAFRARDGWWIPHSDPTGDVGDPEVGGR